MTVFPTFVVCLLIHMFYRTGDESQGLQHAGQESMTDLASLVLAEVY